MHPCPNLVKKDTDRCVTVNDSYRPSAFQQREYCKGGRHKICPFFLGYQKRQEITEPEPALTVSE